MKKQSAVIATTHVDLHNERMTKSALEGMAQQLTQSYIPVIWNHDLRYPPLGRVVSARIEPLPDGESALVAEQELWETGDTRLASIGDGRRMRVEAISHDGLYVAYDRSFHAASQINIIKELAQELGNEEPVFQGKKAFEPLSTLVIGGGLFVLAAVAAGFFGKLGSDAFDRLKSHLKELYRQPSEGERLLDFNLGVAGEHGAYEAHLLVLGPDPDQIDAVLDSGFVGLDEIIRDIGARESDLARVVTIWKDGTIRLAYAVRSDGYPVEVNWDNIPELPRDSPMERT